jgi:hypothetical protein
VPRASVTERSSPRRAQAWCAIACALGVVGCGEVRLGDGPPSAHEEGDAALTDANVVADLASSAEVDAGPTDLGPPDLGPPDFGPPDLAGSRPAA